MKKYTFICVCLTYVFLLLIDPLLFATSEDELFFLKTNQSSPSTSQLNFVAPDLKYGIISSKLTFVSYNPGCPQIESRTWNFLDQSSDLAVDFDLGCFPYNFKLEYFCNYDPKSACYTGTRDNVFFPSSKEFYLNFKLKKKDSDKNKKDSNSNLFPSNIYVVGQIEEDSVNEGPNPDSSSIFISDILRGSCARCSSVAVRGVDVYSCDCYNTMTLFQDILDCQDVLTPESFSYNCISLSQETPGNNVAFTFYNFLNSGGKIPSDRIITVWDCRGNVSKKNCYVK